MTGWMRAGFLLIMLSPVTTAVIDAARMKRELDATCAAGLCRRHSNTSDAIANSTDCAARWLAYEFALQRVPLRAPCVEVFDALELQACGVTRPADTPWPAVPLNISGEMHPTTQKYGLSDSFVTNV